MSIHSGHDICGLRTLRLTLPASQARATAYTYDRDAFIFVYMSAILPVISQDWRLVKVTDILNKINVRTLHELKCSNRLPELFPIMNVFHCIVKRSLHQSVGQNVSKEIIQALGVRTQEGHHSIQVVLDRALT